MPTGIYKRKPNGGKKRRVQRTSPEEHYKLVVQMAVRNGEIQKLIECIKDEISEQSKALLDAKKAFR